MSDFPYQELLPLGADETPYRHLTSDYVSTVSAGGYTFTRVQPQALTLLAREAFKDVSHLLRPGHLAQLRRILDDPEASPNDRFVALDLLKNANIAAGGILPMCQDTGTAIVMGKRGQYVLSEGGDEAALSRGIQETYAALNLRYSQMAPLDMYREKNTGTNLPAQIEIFATDGDAYKFLFMAKGGGSANKSFLFQETKALLNPESLLAFVERSSDRSVPRRALRTISRSSSAEPARSRRSRSRSLLPRATSTLCRRRATTSVEVSGISIWKRRSS
jgi:fumarate hydratase, class I